MHKHLYSTRLKELRALVKEQDLSRLSRRLLDLFADVELPPALRKRAIGLRASYNAFVQLGQEAHTHADWEEMYAEALELVEAVGAALAQLPEPVAPEAVPAAPSAEMLLRRPVFEGRGITKVFRTAKHSFRLPEIDLELNLGEITGVVGENGNGKTTLLRIVAGDLQVSGGKLRYPAFEVPEGDWYRIKQHIAFIPQHLPAWNGFLKENLHFTAAIHGIKGRENEERVDFVIHRLGLTKYEDALWSEISSGYKLRFELARALVWHPRLLIIDEPLANLDINTQQVFLQDLRYLAKSSLNPISILLSSQHLHELESIADNILFIKNGEILYNGKMKDFGKDRKENLFEIGTAASKASLMEALQQLKGLRIEDHGQTKTIHTPVNTEAGKLLQLLVDANITVNYFRDISTSTLKLFRQNASKT